MASAICEALFDHAIFGIEEMQVMLSEMIEKYFSKCSMSCLHRGKI
jgi:hypothetical protein